MRHIVHIAAASIFVDKIMIHDLRRMLSRYRITVVCAPGQEVAHIRREGFTVHTIPIRRKMAPFADLKSLWSLTRFLRSCHADVVHTYGPKAGLLGQLAAKAARVSVAVHGCRGLLYTDDMPRWRRALYRGTDRLTNTMAKAVLYVSKADLQFSVHTGLVSRDKARHTGTGVDIAYFGTSTSSRQQALAAHEIPSDTRVLLTVARYVAAKGYLELARAASLVARSRSDVTFVWVAPIPPDEEDTLPDALLTSADGARIIRVDGLDDVRGIYRVAELLVHPSHREGVPRVLMEAALAGVPIVASDIPGCRELIDDGEHGWLCRVGDADDLAAAILDALEHPEEAKRRAAAAKSRVTTEFDQDRLTERIMAVYDELLS